MSKKLPIRLNRLAVTPELILPRVGSVLVPVRPPDDLALLRFKEGVWLNGNITQPRNPKTHKLYFKVIALAVAVWPEDHEPNPEGDENHLRAWLQCKAGRCHWYDFSPRDTDTVVALIRDVRGDGKFAFVREVYLREKDEHRLRVYIPDTIEYEALGEDEFRPIKEAVFEIIEMVIGVKIEDLLKNAEAA